MMTVFTVYLVDMLINSIVPAPGDVVIDQHESHGNTDTCMCGEISDNPSSWDVLDNVCIKMI